jgi:DNA-binding XRE family transcriptional regulator
MSDQVDYWTTAEVADYLGVHPGTVSSYRAREQMPPPDHRFGRTLVWRPETIRQWAELRPRARGRRQPVDMAAVDIECLADELVQARTALGVTQIEVAARAEVNPSTVARIEAARPVVSTSLAAVFRAVGLLLTVTEVPTP